MSRKYIFIDTNIFERDHFRFDFGILERVKRLIDNGEFTLLTNSIIQHEIDQHINIKATEIIAKYKQFKKLGLMMLDSPSYKSLKINITHEELANKIRESKHRFFANAIDILVNTADLNQIVNSYFNSKPPFSSGSKKHEFPDAIFLSALTNWAALKKQEIIVVSQDKEIIEYCNSDKFLNPIESLRELVNKTFETLMYSQSIEVFKLLWDEISEKIVSLIDKIGVTCSHDYDAEVLSYSITFIDRSTEFMTHQENDEVTLSCTAQVSINADLRYPNPSMIFYDKEEEERYILDFIENNVDNEIDIDYTVKIKFDQLNITKHQLLDVSIDQPSIIDIYPEEL